MSTHIKDCVSFESFRPFPFVDVGVQECCFLIGNFRRKFDRRVMIVCLFNEMLYSVPVCSPHGTAMGTKMAVAFSNIFMNKVETGILSQSLFKPLVWKRYIDDIFSLWITNRHRIGHFIEQANNHYPTIKFTAKISDKETTFLDTYIYKGERFERDAKPLLKPFFVAK